MPGFLISNFRGDFKLNNRFNNKCITNEIINEKYIIKRNTLNKFLNDKVFYEDEEFILIVEGVVLNKDILIKKTHSNSFQKTVKKLIINGNDEFFSEFRGSFSGAVYYKKNDQWIIYTNQVGDKAIFYYSDDGNFIIGSQVNYLLDIFDELKLPKTLNEKAVYFMLTYGFMGDNSTYLKEINRLEPGSYIMINSGGVFVHSYHKFNNKKYDLTNCSEDEIIEMIDEKFTAAITREYNKDLEYGLRHLVDLSGGLDSRMNVWVAKKCNNGKYNNLLNITYSQSNYLDEILAKKIAAHLNNEIIVKTLDDASFVYDVDEIVKMNFGLSLYSAITGGKRLFDCICFDEFGIEHTGQIAEAVLGTLIHSKDEIDEKEISYTYSSKLINKMDKKHLEKYYDKDSYLMHVRAINGTLSTHLIRQNYTEVAAPSLDVDFIELCLSIPIEYRINHHIYKKWIMKKYPEAANYKWEKIDAKISDSNTKVLFIRLIKHGFGKLCRLLGVKSPKRDLGTTMNPFDYWYNSNENVKTFMDEYFQTNIKKCNTSKEVKDDLEMLYWQGNTIEKTQVITALSAIKFYMEDRNDQ